MIEEKTKKIIEDFEEKGLTFKELGEEYNYTPYQMKGKINDLRQRGLITKT